MSVTWRGWLHAVTALILVVSVASCRKKPPEIPEETAQLIEAVRDRPVPDELQARFQIKLRSKPLGLSGTTGGGLQVARPGRGRIEIFGPIGGSLATLLADGDALAALIPKDQRHLHAPDAESVIREATGGAAGVDDLLALLVGDMPFDDAEVTSTEVVDDFVRATFTGPEGVVVEADLDPASVTPIRLVARDAKNSLLLEARYEGWEPLDGQLLPERVEVDVPAVDLSIVVRYQGWRRPEKLMSFDTSAPEGFTTLPLIDVVRGGMAALQAAQSE